MKKQSEVDALFALPLGEFTEARNALAARLKKEKRTDEAQQVKSLTKPTATAWAVNQLYWHHRADFDRLVAISDKVRKAQSGRAGDLRALIDERRKLMASLASAAAQLLSEAGNATSLDARRRVSTTLESLASRDRSEIEQLAGHLTTDLDPLGFESLGGLLAASSSGKGKVLDFRPGAKAKPVAAKEHASKKSSASKADSAKARAEAERAAREQAEALKAAERALTSARREAARAEAAAAKATAQREALQQEMQELEERLEAATKAERAANDEVKQTARAVTEAERAVTNARNKR